MLKRYSRPLLLSGGLAASAALGLGYFYYKGSLQTPTVPSGMSESANNVFQWS